MNKMTQLVQDYDYLTPKMAEKSGISKFKFTSMFMRMDWNRWGMEFIPLARNGWMNCMCFIRDVPKLFFRMMKLFIIII